MSQLLWRPILILTISLIAAQASFSQDQAELLFDNAKTFMNAGKYTEALTDLESLVNSFGDTDWAPKALLELGQYYYTVEEDFDRATDYFSQIQSKYVQSTEAPAAMYFKALISERRGETVAELESAAADLVRMENLYPNNAWRPRALFLWGKLTFRLGNYTEAMRHFQDLEFGFPNSQLLPSALLHVSRAAYLSGKPTRAASVLARLQARFPNTPEYETAESYLRLLGRFTGATPEYQLDRTFFGTTPKTFSSPRKLMVTSAWTVAVEDNKSLFFVEAGGNGPRPGPPSRDFSEFLTARDGTLLLAYENRIIAENGSGMPSLSMNGNPPRDIKSAAIDSYGRIFVVENDLRDLAAFSPNGSLLRTFSLDRPRLVRHFAGEIWVLAGNQSTIMRYSASFNPLESPFKGLSSIEDFRFDPFGNIYVLSDKGSSVTILKRDGTPHHTMNLKSGSFPLKQAESIAVDNSGAVYLSDRRGGSVFRFF